MIEIIKSYYTYLVRDFPVSFLFTNVILAIYEFNIRHNKWLGIVFFFCNSYFNKTYDM